MVSIIIPAYNCEKYISNCLDSVLRQTYSDIEIIVVNDGSTDNTLGISNSYKEKTSKVKIINQPNKGVSSARNAGLDICLGEYILFVDADDELYETAVETLMNYSSSHDVDLICGGVTIQKSNQIYVNDIPVERTIVDKKEIINELVTPQYTSCWAKMYKKELIADIRFEDGRKINEDSFFVFQYVLKCKSIGYVDVPIYKYLFHASSASHAGFIFQKKFYDILYFRDKKIETLKEHGADSEVIDILFLNSSVEFYNKLLFDDTKQIERKELLKELKRKRHIVHVLPIMRRLTVTLLLSFPLAYAYLFKKKYEVKNG